MLDTTTKLKGGGEGAARVIREADFSEREAALPNWVPPMKKWGKKEREGRGALPEGGERILSLAYMLSIIQLRNKNRSLHSRDSHKG